MFARNSCLQSLLACLPAVFACCVCVLAPSSWLWRLPACWHALSNLSLTVACLLVCVCCPNSCLRRSLDCVTFVPACVRLGPIHRAARLAAPVALRTVGSAILASRPRSRSAFERCIRNERSPPWRIILCILFVCFVCLLACFEYVEIVCCVCRLLVCVRRTLSPCEHS